MRYERMTLDEFARYQQAIGIKAGKVDDTWWAEVRPCFFRPLFPFAAIDPEHQQYPLKSLIGGCLHAVPGTVAANAQVNMFIYDQLQQYSLGQLNEKHRYITRKGIKNFVARKILDRDLFIREVYGIYVSFYGRTEYAYKDERLNKRCFAAWADALFTVPKLLVIGAYYEDKLCAIDVSYLVEDVVIDETFFSDTASLKLKVTDFMLHTLRETAAASDAKYLFRGFPSGQRSLDEAKLMRGCKVLNMPARLKINPAVEFMARLFMKDSYAKLREIISPSLPEKGLRPCSQPE